MRPPVIVDAWSEPLGSVVLARSRLFPWQVAVLLSVRHGSDRVWRRTCVAIGDTLVVSQRGVLAARVFQLFMKRSGREISR
jgi:hypothetical protein